ncbi:MAG TPA: UDP-glucose--hexose-1-phosphate uridylyltransferase [Candidatus Avoscillospira stercoripullorum]|uniref:Galactose-1-phosphate uridylyltransferase n=1 Tax=Candidatus Avoscillospira stercoripullorum TaxID=2840709 RepID=A0A9D1D641_9FIRM|nr:UDP-glucose--hexose-1-phosphate uridylyltransferase [Candidatus Avoscillospira stercoripullorum]
MTVNGYLTALVEYGLKTGLIQDCDRTYIVNQLLMTMELDSFEEEAAPPMELEDILAGLLSDAVSRGVIEDNITAKDLFDTKLMGVLTPLPREVRAKFAALYAEDPQKATDWYYTLSQDTDYIRRYRIKKDLRWKTATEYGDLDITINLSKPEKDPKAIAAAKAAPQSGYPKCQLCPENEGYAGRMNHPARENHRIVPITVAGANWYLQYSPYVYYNEHCIVFNAKHTPMVIDKSAFSKLLDFVTLFPHYFVGSNADLPIVGGSILSHEHFQGGHYSFPMELSPVEREIHFAGYEDIKAGIVKWPMSVIRLDGADKARLADLADKILRAWRGYTDADAFIFAETDGVPHSTITPIARRRGSDYELDLVLRNNITTKEHPLGVYHPHAELHHIKKENIGLIEVMGLAVLPARLKGELQGLEEAILAGKPLTGDLEKHAAWVEELKTRHTFTPENTTAILREEVGKVFAKVLEHAGVYGRNEAGQAAFLKFIDYVNSKED